MSKTKAAASKRKKPSKSRVAREKARHRTHLQEKLENRNRRSSRIAESSHPFKMPDDFDELFRMIKRGQL